MPPGRLGSGVRAEAVIFEATDVARLDDAKPVLTTRALEDPDDAVAPLLLGLVHAEQGSYGAAALAYDEALERHVRIGGHARFEGQLRLLRGRARMALGRADDARVDLLLAAIGPDPEVARAAQALLTGLAVIRR